jgi:hypothetical protein
LNGIVVNRLEDKNSEIKKGVNEMAKTPIGEKATDVPYKDKRFTKNDLAGVKQKETQAIKDFHRKVRGEK